MKRLIVLSVLIIILIYGIILLIVDMIPGGPIVTIERTIKSDNCRFVLDDDCDSILENILIDYDVGDDGSKNNDNFLEFLKENYKCDSEDSCKRVCGCPGY